ncbi:short transient receptor potential channel 4-associated protein [Lepeophtheirus salmonis]|uniref:short transient receptor potential channel 4-associated protein n=1 Tax=Lepeophtheirus salmonis TaxID=72036 RepID=UPI001AE640F6|nr:short transient receptor potential channel 4-associated protein-like [Lepeophtheirus salmonis]
MSSRWIHRKFYRSKNLLTSINESQRVGGGGSSSISLIDVSLLSDSENQLRKIRDASNENSALIKLLPILRALETAKEYQALILPHLRRLNEMLSESVDEEVKTLSLEFVEWNGLLILLSLVFSGHPETVLLSFKILNKLCVFVDEASAIMSESREILTFAFQSFTSDLLFDEARKLVESILLNTPPLNLCSIPHFQKILSQLEGKKLASFCKILAVTVSDLDIYKDHKNHSLFSENCRNNPSVPLPVKDINQELTLSVPGFLQKLVDQATKLPYLPRFSSLPTEIDHWVRLIDDVISDELARPNLSLEPFSALIGGDLMDRVEALYVLSLFLIGRHRKRVQKELSELKLVPKLSDLFDQFIWRYNAGRQRARLPGHTSRCECSPEVAVKMQFLRLIYGFCDHNEYKHLLLSPYEWEELKRIKPTDSSVQDWDLAKSPISPSLMCSGTSGLLTKIVEVLKKEHTNSTYRFWLCRAVESYIRGQISYADQVFLLRRGLLQHITASLINTDRRQKEIIQSSFDLLGELIKFNFDACRQMDAILSTGAKLKRAMSLINERLVDSNMFIRGMVLASDHFLHSSDPEAVNFVNNSRLLSLFRDLDKHIGYVIKLIRKIKVNNLTQENVSCLNTSLIIIMLSHRKHELPHFLEELSFRVQREALSHGSNPPFMLHFRKLLTFWQEHYFQKAKDCTQLEQSSRIPFEFWKNTVDSLISSDANSNISLLHYHNTWFVEKSANVSFTSFMEVE